MNEFDQTTSGCDSGGTRQSQSPGGLGEDSFVIEEEVLVWG